MQSSFFARFIDLITYFSNILKSESFLSIPPNIKIIFEDRLSIAAHVAFKFVALESL